MADRICSLCGTYYTDEKGHDLDDCWGLIHQQLLKADRVVRGLRYKLAEAQRRINETKADEVPKTVSK